jgi:hypothetical protein
VKRRYRLLINSLVVLLLTILFGASLGWGIYKDQLGEVLFNATLV